MNGLKIFAECVSRKKHLLDETAKIHCFCTKQQQKVKLSEENTVLVVGFVRLAFLGPLAATVYQRERFGSEFAFSLQNR